MYKIGWFSTGRDEAARELLTTIYNAIEKKELNVEISYVFSDREKGEFKESDKFFNLVESYDIPLITFSSRKFKPEMIRSGKKDIETLNKWRIDFDKNIMNLLKNYSVDINVMAGYMLITGDELCKQLNMINIHPAKPNGQKGTWQEVIWQLIENKETETGVMMHLVTENLDEGPPITFCKFPIIGEKFNGLWEDFDKKLKYKTLKEIKNEEGETNKLFIKIREQGFKRELPLILQTIKEFAQGRVSVENQRIIVGGKVIDCGFDLSHEIDEKIESR